MPDISRVQKHPELTSSKIEDANTTIMRLLAGGFNPSEKYEFVSWDDEIPN